MTTKDLVKKVSRLQDKAHDLRDQIKKLQIEYQLLNEEIDLLAQSEEHDPRVIRRAAKEYHLYFL